MTKKLTLIIISIFCFSLQNSNAAFPVATSKSVNTMSATAKEISVNRTVEKEIIKSPESKKEAKAIAKKETKNFLSSLKAAGGKSQLVALLLAIFVGGIGIHRFYLGYTWQGVVQLLTAGGCGIWALIDLIRIITGNLQPKNGPYDKTL